MLLKAEKQKAELIESAVKLASKRLGAEKTAPVERFIRQYFENVPPRDIVAANPESLFGAAMAHRKFGMARNLGEARVRVYTANLEEHGWQSEHTVVEIVNDDMPFLVESVIAELNRRELAIHILIHPILSVCRDGKGKLLDVFGPACKEEKAIAESFIHVEVSAQSSARLDEIRQGIESVLRDVRAAVEDWPAMRDRMLAVTDEMQAGLSGTTDNEGEEVVDFLRWIHADHFVFLGFREYTFKWNSDQATVSSDPDSGLGILRDPAVPMFDELQDLADMPPEVRAFVRKPDLLAVTKTNMKSPVHRPVHMDSIGIKRFNDKGKVIGQRMFVGLFTSAAYNLTVRAIPLMRLKLQRTLERAGFLPASHDGRALTNILETFPRDELFQVSEDHLFQTSLGILHLQDRRRVALFIRRDDFERFISCLVYIPRDRYDTDLRVRIQGILEKALGGTMSSYTTQLGGSPLARLNVIIETKPGAIPAYDADEIEAELVATARWWADHLQDALVNTHGEEKGLSLFQRYRWAFRSGYRERFNAAAAIADVAKVEKTLETDALGISLYRPIEAADNQIRFKVYHPDQPIPLSDVLPVLEHMGLKVMEELPYPVYPETDGTRLVMMHDFGLETRDGSDVDLGAVRENFQEAFRHVWRGVAESDRFNALVLGAGLSWRQVVILRAYCKYLRQAGIAFSQAYMQQTLSNNPQAARLIVNLFMTLFDPAGGKEAGKNADQIRRDLNDYLDTVISADEDRILRRFINLVDCTLRTNFFQPAEDGEAKSYVSFKLDSQQVEELPLPRPLVEIFVYSPRVEAVHLRGGRVARGGIRWSDRPEDFRTEILGLMKAQTVKNTVIVPIGSKGGFVVKRPPASGDREAFHAEGIECYKILMRGMLDITDNLKGDDIIAPLDVVRRDEDDPYLVVAADKGTATFSDIANGISQDYGFWLDDAFASGGSQGYDHKDMGITARGAWESVKRHFREINVDTQSQDFTVVGVGDMSGDVFGNGMLLSQHIKLLGAFNHLHILVDPDPDPAKSFAERQRLYDLPRSNWSDYDAKLISKGGGVFDRKAKTIPVSPQMKKRFAIDKDKITPSELIRVLLRLEMDLLWLGGIGTYVKATDETHVQAGDRSNDGLRVDAAELRCKVVAEGANLGLTQRARIECGLAGIRLNTDAIDNSAGVDTSDHEVNIKVLLGAVVDSGDMTLKQRNKLLAEMTDEVGELVLKDNYRQTQAISMVEAQGEDVLNDQVRLMRMLERIGRLNREVEFLPDEETIAERIKAKLSLTRPEIAVLIAYSKIWLYEELLKTDIPVDPRLANDLVRYFPTPVRKKYRQAIANHRIRREIIATHVANSMINRVGGTFVNQIAEKTGMPVCDIARAYTITRKIYVLRGLWDGIEALDNKVPASAQIAMLLDITRLIERGTMWFLRQGRRPLEIGSHVAEFSEGLQILTDNLEDTLLDNYRQGLAERAGVYTDQGVPEDLARRIAGLVNLASGCDIVRLAAQRSLSVPDVARLFFAVGARFRLGRLRSAAESLQSESHWQKLAVEALIEEIYGHQVAITSKVLDAVAGKKPSEKSVDVWVAANRDAVDRTETMLSEMWAVEIGDLSMIAVASRQLRTLAET
jgi:glutamate dehydrogenase